MDTMRGKKEDTLEKLGNSILTKNERVALALRILVNLMTQCWQSRYGDLSMIQIPYSITCLSQNTSQMVQYLMLKNNRPLMPKIAF